MIRTYIARIDGILANPGNLGFIFEGKEIISRIAITSLRAHRETGGQRVAIDYDNGTDGFAQLKLVVKTLDGVSVYEFLPALGNPLIKKEEYSPEELEQDMKYLGLDVDKLQLMK